MPHGGINFVVDIINDWRQRVVALKYVDLLVVTQLASLEIFGKVESRLCCKFLSNLLRNLLEAACACQESAGISFRSWEFQTPTLEHVYLGCFTAYYACIGTEHQNITGGSVVTRVCSLVPGINLNQLEAVWPTVFMRLSTFK